MGISKWNAGIIRPVPVAPTGPYETGSAPGVWTVDQQAYWQKQGLWPTAGNVPPTYIEDMFSTYLYTGNGSTQTITNNIDLAGKGGLVWIKDRTSADDHYLTDTARGAQNTLFSNTTGAQTTGNPNNLNAFTSTGFTVGINLSASSSNKYASWTFREQPKFFDIVTYTGDGTSGRQISHNLGSAPGMIIVKRTDATRNWVCYHQALGNGSMIILNSTAAVDSASALWNNTTPTSTYFTVNNDIDVNGSGATYVAYLFAHDAGGFGLTGTDNVISCGSFTTTGTIGTVTLGYEPQWVMMKDVNTDDGLGWFMYDNMRGMTGTGTGSTAARLLANTSGTENPTTGDIKITSTGFVADLNSSRTYIYIAIRRGPMAVPTLGTSVFSPQVQTPTAGANNIIAASSGFPIDWLPTRQKDIVTDWYQTSRLTNNYMSPNTSAAEGAYTYGFDKMTGVGGGVSGWNATSTVSYAFRRAPGFFDEVCYTGTGTSGQTFSHNLAAVPELMIVKQRNTGRNWTVYSAPSGATKYQVLNNVLLAQASTGMWNDTAPTSTVFSVGNSFATNEPAGTYVNYLFATCAGVSKVGSYTGTGALQTVACGFTSGARFVLIKRTDENGDWYVWNSARGISSGNDPYLLLNDTAAEVTGTNYVDTDTTGFKVTAAAPAGINASGGTYIFLAIA